MEIKNITIQNFRCFKNYEVSLAPKTTVFIGKNGTGKSTLINSIKAAVSFIFSKYKDKNEKFELLGNTPDLHLVNLSKTDAYIDRATNFYNYPININCEANYKNIDLNWSIVKNTANGKLLDTMYREAFLKFTRDYNADLKNTILPVFAFFSDSYPHKKINIGSYAKSVLKSGKIPRAFAYYQWDAEANCAEIWQNRYVSQYSKINDFKNTEKDTINERNEINFIDNRIKAFTSILNNKYEFINNEFAVRKIGLERPLKDENSISIKFIFEDNREIFFEHLPQGYNRLLSIVFDIAYRSYLLNGDKEPQGVVLIDEIELHLHPTLQQEVIQRFKKAFPEIQFIISTHSPVVVSNLKADGIENKIIKLSHHENTYSNSNIDNVYGIDYATNLNEVMEVAPRSSTIDKYINAHAFLYRKGKIAEAEQMLDMLTKYIGGPIPPALAREIENNKNRAI